MIGAQTELVFVTNVNNYCIIYAIIMHTRLHGIFFCDLGMTKRRLLYIFFTFELIFQDKSILEIIQDPEG